MTAASMPAIRLSPYGRGHFRDSLPYAPVGYLFTVPGSFPQDTHAHTNIPDMQAAVYRLHGDWEVRDVNGGRKVWGIGRTRGAAIDSAFAVLYRERLRRAAEITDSRRLCGLEAVPPYAVEVIDERTLVLTRTGTGLLHKIQSTTPTTYLVTGLDDREAKTVPAADAVLRTTTVGVLHERCGCQPPDAAWFNNEDDAREHAEEALTVWWPCENQAEPYCTGRACEGCTPPTAEDPYDECCEATCGCCPRVEEHDHCRLAPGSEEKSRYCDQHGEGWPNIH